MTKDRSISAVIARLRDGDSDGDDHDIAAAELERLRAHHEPGAKPVFPPNIDCRTGKPEAKPTHAHNCSSRLDSANGGGFDCDCDALNRGTEP